MSACRHISIMCDNCDDEEYFHAAVGIVEARRRLRANGWRTGLKPSPDLPSTPDVRVDLCAPCAATVPRVK